MFKLNNPAILLIFGLSLSAALPSHSQDSNLRTFNAEALPALVESDSKSLHTKSKNRFALSFENDFFAPGSGDRDYTFGVSGNLTNESLADSRFTAALRQVDALLGFKEAKREQGSIELGFYAFTPEISDPNLRSDNDRPFSSLIYASSAIERIDVVSESVFRTQLNIGVLGLDLVGNLQNAAHELMGNAKEDGWNEQISNGGELTFRYSIAKQNLIFSDDNIELKHTRTASIGYITEASWGLNLRIGDTKTAWHSFNPEIATYAESAVRKQNRSSEKFLWAGVAIKVRGYNVFLQGQFRDSERQYSSDELNHALIEAWLGYTHGLNNGYFFSYGLRGHSSEIKSGVANRNVIWGGIMIGRRLS